MKFPEWTKKFKYHKWINRADLAWFNKKKSCHGGTIYVQQINSATWMEIKWC